jgi:hypothetical protein
MRILHVEDGVVGALLLGELEIELELAVGLAQQEEEAGRVGADLVEHLAQGDELAGALAHPHGLAAAGEVDELDQQHARLSGSPPSAARAARSRTT